MEADHAAAPARPPAKASRWEDFIDIFYKPGAVFQRRAEQSVWPPILILTVVGLAVSYFTYPAVQPLYQTLISRTADATIASSPGADPALIRASVARSITFSGQFGAVFTGLVAVVLGFALWIAGKLLGSRQTVHAAIVVGTYTLIGLLLEGIANGLQGIVMDLSNATSRFAVTLGPGRFLDVTKGNVVVDALIVHLTIFSVWRAALVAIGLRATGGLSMGKAWAASTLVWLAASILILREIIVLRGS